MTPVEERSEQIARRILDVPEYALAVPIDSARKLARDHLKLLTEYSAREERLQAALESIERGEDDDPALTASHALEEEYSLEALPATEPDA